MTHFDRQANQYDKYSGIQRVLARQLLSLCPSKNYKTILDLGCGTGYLTKKIAQKYPEAVIISLDKSQQMLARLREKYHKKQISTLNENIENFTPKINYDLIISNFSFQWLDSPIEQIKRYYKMLNPEGFFTINLPHKSNFAQLQQSYKECSITYPEPQFNSYEKFIQNLKNEKLNIIKNTITTYFTSTQSFYRNLHKIGAIKKQNQLRTSELYKIVKYHNNKYSSLIPFKYHYLIITSK